MTLALIITGFLIVNFMMAGVFSLVACGPTEPHSLGRADAVGVEGRGRRPVGEDAQHAHLPVQDIEQPQDVAVAGHHRLID